MTQRITIRPVADRDLDEQAAYIAEDNLRASIRFYEAARLAFRQLAEMPGLGMLREFDNPHLRELRSYAVPGFSKYLIFYQPSKDGIEVIRVLHGARDIERIFKR